MVRVSYEVKSQVSILHFTKGTGYLGRGSRYDQVWGTVRSGLTPGSPLGRRTSEIPDPEPENPEKLEKPVPPYFAPLRPNQGTYRHCRGIHGSGLT